MNTNEYLNAVKEKHALTSDYQLGKILGSSSSRIGNYRSGKNQMSEDLCVLVAELLTSDPLTIIADIKRQTARHEGTRETWERIFNNCTQHAAAFMAVFVLVLGLGSFSEISKAGTLEAPKSAQTVYYVKWRKAIVATLSKLFSFCGLRHKLPSFLF